MLLIFVFLFLIVEIKSNDDDSKEKLKKENEEEKNNEEEEIKEEEEEKEGGIMTDEEFGKKLEKILEEKHLKKKHKITKDILKQIFVILYEKDFELPEVPEESKEDVNLDPKEETKRFLNEIFFKLTRSLDYDDEILITDIKEWISPKKVQSAVNDIIENLIGMMGNMKNMGDNDL